MKPKGKHGLMLSDSAVRPFLLQDGIGYAHALNLLMQDGIGYACALNLLSPRDIHYVCLCCGCVLVGLSAGAKFAGVFFVPYRFGR